MLRRQRRHCERSEAIQSTDGRWKPEASMQPFGERHDLGPWIASLRSQ
jgi:hypothetical protein